MPFPLSAPRPAPVAAPIPAPVPVCFVQALAPSMVVSSVAATKRRAPRIILPPGASPKAPAHRTPGRGDREPSARGRRLTLAAARLPRSAAGPLRPSAGRAILARPRRRTPAMSDAPASTTPRPSTALRRAVVGATLLAGLFAAGGTRAVSRDEFRARTARELLDLCSGSGSGGDALPFCYGYITGAGDLHQTLVKANAIKP